MATPVSTRPEPPPLHKAHSPALLGPSSSPILTSPCPPNVASQVSFCESDRGGMALQVNPATSISLCPGCPRHTNRLDWVDQCLQAAGESQTLLSRAGRQQAKGGPKPPLAPAPTPVVSITPPPIPLVNPGGNRDQVCLDGIRGEWSVVRASPKMTTQTPPKKAPTCKNYFGQISI